jgi:5-methylcytosine-specific restriction protein A
MPNLPLRPCSEPGCAALVADGRCASHRQQRQQHYDERRGTPARRGYDADHLHLRLLCFERDQWQCVTCGWEPKLVTDHCGYGLGIPPTARVVAYLRGCYQRGERHLHADHKVRVDLAPELRLDLENYQTLCDACHRAKTMGEIRAAGAGPTGAPRSRAPVASENCRTAVPSLQRGLNLREGSATGEPQAVAARGGGG